MCRKVVVAGCILVIYQVEFHYLERFLYYTTVRVSNKIIPFTYMEAVALTVKATQARQHQHSSLRLSCYLLMWAVAYLVK